MHDTYWLDVVLEGVEEVGAFDSELLHRVGVHFDFARSLDESVHRGRLSRPHEALELRPGEVLRLGRQLLFKK